MYEMLKVSEYILVCLTIFLVCCYVNHRTKVKLRLSQVKLKPFIQVK